MQRRKKIFDTTLLVLIYLSAIIVTFSFVAIIFQVVFSGVSDINSSFLATIAPILLNTILMVFLSLLFSVPISICSAIYLNEYAKPGKTVSAIRFAVQCLTGVPSILFGLFGLAFFVKVLNYGFSLLSGALTLSMMVLPTIINTVEESLKSVPYAYREASLALGATKLRTIVKVVLPTCSAGIANSIILAAGRVIGETAALIFTAGTVPALAKGLFGSGRTLAVHMFLLAREATTMNEAYATALVLIILSLLFNIAANFMSRRRNAS